MSGDSAGFEVGTVSSADLARHLKLLRNDLFRRCRNQQTARPTSGAVAVQGTQSDVPGTVNSLRSVMGRMASARTPASPYRQSARPSQQRLTLSSRATEDSVGGGSEVPQERQVTHRLASSRSASPVVDTGSDSSSTACRSPKGTGVEKKKQTARRSPLSHRSSCSPSPKESDSRGSRVASTKAGERKKTATETAVSVQSRALQQKFQGLTAKYSNLVRLAAGYKAKAKESAEQLDEAKGANRKLTEDLAAAEGLLEQLRANTVSKHDHDDVKALLSDAQETIKSRAAEVELVKKQLQAEQQEKAKLQVALSAMKQAGSRGRRRNGPVNADAVDWAEQQQSTTGIAHLLRELEKLRSSIKTKDQRGRQLQDEVSQIRESLAVERRKAEKAQQQLACFMQRMDSLRRHRIQTEARACRQAQEIASLRAELASEKENRQILLQILDHYVPDVVGELRQRMHTPSSCFPPSLDPRGVGHPGQTEKLSPFAATSPCSSRPACRSPKPESGCIGVSRREGNSGVCAAAAEFRSLPPLVASREPLPSSPSVPRPISATANAEDWTGSRASSPDDRLRLLRTRGLFRRFAYGDDPSEGESGPSAALNLLEPVKELSSATQLTVEQMAFEEKVCRHDESWAREENPVHWRSASEAGVRPLPPLVETVPATDSASLSTKRVPSVSLARRLVETRLPQRERQSPQGERALLLTNGKAEDEEKQASFSGHKRTEKEEDTKQQTTRVCSEGSPDKTHFRGSFQPAPGTRQPTSATLSLTTPMAPPTPHCQPLSPLSQSTELESGSWYGELSADRQLSRQHFRTEKNAVVSSTETTSCHDPPSHLELPSSSNLKHARCRTMQSPFPSPHTEKDKGNALIRPLQQFCPTRSRALQDCHLSHEDDWCIPQHTAGLHSDGAENDHEDWPSQTGAETAEVHRKERNRNVLQSAARSLPTQDFEPTAALTNVCWSGTVSEGRPLFSITHESSAVSCRDSEGRPKVSSSQGIAHFEHSPRDGSVVGGLNALMSSQDTKRLSSDIGLSRRPPASCCLPSRSGADKPKEDCPDTRATPKSAEHAEELWNSEGADKRHIQTSAIPCGAETKKQRKGVEKRTPKSSRSSASETGPTKPPSSSLKRGLSGTSSSTSGGLTFHESSRISVSCDSLSGSSGADSVDMGLSEDSCSASPVLLAEAAHPVDPSKCLVTEIRSEPHEEKAAATGWFRSNANEPRSCRRQRGETNCRSASGLNGNDIKSDVMQRVRAGAARAIQKRWRSYKNRKLAAGKRNGRNSGEASSLSPAQATTLIQPEDSESMTDVPGLHQSYRLGSEQIMGHSVEVTKALESQSGDSSISPEKPEQSFPCSSSSCRNVEPSDDKDADLAGPSIGTHIILKGNHDGSDAPECGLQNVREAATPHQKERTLPPLPPNDMALALQEAKLRWQIQYYAAMHKYYSMQLQQGAMDPSEEPEDRLLPRASFHDILCEGVAVDEDPMQMSMEELLAQSTSVFEETGAPHQ